MGSSSTRAVYLDTHVVVWLNYGRVEDFALQVRNLIESNDLKISPIVRLELALLNEIGRIHETSDTIVENLGALIGLTICDASFQTVAKRACAYSWTRDPFDRLICAQAAFQDAILITKDRLIRRHYKKATWT